MKMPLSDVLIIHLKKHPEDDSHHDDQNSDIHILEVKEKSILINLPHHLYLDGNSQTISLVWKSEDKIHQFEAKARIKTLHSSQKKSAQKKNSRINAVLEFISLDEEKWKQIYTAIEEDQNILDNMMKKLRGW